MAQRKIQLLRSQTVYADLTAARQSLDLTFANTAGLGDGEIVLARYYATEETIGGNPKTVVRSLLGIFNNKDNKPGFTYITNEPEIRDLFMELSDRLDSVDQAIDALDLNEPIGGSTGTAVTEIDQQNGQVSGTATPVEDLTMDDYTRTNDTGDIDAGDSLEVAFSKLENAISNVDVDIHSTGETIDITDDATGKNLEVNIDGVSIIQDLSTKKLRTNLQISKITTNLATNVKEAYRLTDGFGNSYGQRIDIYKDSALKDVYLGNAYDSVDEQTGEIRNVSWVVITGLEFITPQTYANLSALEKTLYEEGTFEGYIINNETITDVQYENLDSSQKELYTMHDPATGIWTVDAEMIRLTEERYLGLSETQKLLYTLSYEQGYVIKEETLTEEEKQEIYGETHPTVYRGLYDVSLGGSPKDNDQSLNFVYQLSDGTYQMVKIDVSKFITESEFGVGLITNGNVVEVNYGDGLARGSGGFHAPIKVNIGNGLDFAEREEGEVTAKVEIKIDDTNSDILTVSSDGLAIDTTELMNVVEDQLWVKGTLNTQTVTLGISPSDNSLYANVNIGTSPSGTNVIETKSDGIYVDSTWDCGEY